MKFQLRQLEAFRAVAEAGNMTKAAKVLGISQPAVSRLLADFSASTGLELFTRSKGLLQPTSDSRYLLAEVERILDRLDYLDDLRRDLSERAGGHIRIACLPGFAVSHLPGVLVKFLKERPSVTVTLEPDRPDRILEWVIGQQYDCGLTDGFLGHPATTSQDLYVKSVCVLPKGHPLGERDHITPTDLKDERLIHTRRDSRYFQHLSHVFLESGVEMNSVVEVRQFTAACTMVSEGLGASVVSVIDAEAFRKSGIVIRPFRPDIFHRLSVLLPASGPSSPVVLDFVDSFIDSMQPYLSDER